MIGEVQELIARHGGVIPLAKALGINKQAIYGWTKVPAERIIEVERFTGIPREKLRPDIFLAPRPDPCDVLAREFDE